MIKQIVIGKQGNQPFPIADPNVSRRHATLYYDDATGVMNIVDSSTNGTFVSNAGGPFLRIQPGQPVQVTPDTMLRLGPETRFHVRRLLPASVGMASKPGGGIVIEEVKPKKQPEPKKANIAHLRRVSEDYHERKTKIENEISSLNGLRSLTIVFATIATGGSAFISNNLGLSSGETVLVSVSILVVLITSLLLIINSRMKKVTAARAENERNYAVKYVCPECHYSFRGQYYENIIATASCPKCKAKYHEAS